MSEGFIWNSWFWLGGVVLITAMSLDRMVAWAQRHSVSSPPLSRRRCAHVTRFPVRSREKG